MIFSGFFSRRSGLEPGEIAHDDLAEALKSRSCVLVDVREPHEFSAGHVPGSVNHPLSRFDPHRLPADKPGRADLPLRRAVCERAEPGARCRTDCRASLSWRRHGLAKCGRPTRLTPSKDAFCSTE